GAYTYRRQINIANGASTALPAGYTIRVPLDPVNFAGKVRADDNDVRVFADALDVEHDRIFDLAPPNLLPAAWFALDAPIQSGATDVNYWLYYGDANAAAGPQKGSNVFAFYDGFDSAPLSSTLWLVNGTPSISGGQLT